MEKNMNCIVPTLSALYALQNHVEGECVFCEEDGKIYTWQEDSGWGPVGFENKGISMNLYDLNKSVISQLPALTYPEVMVRMEVVQELYNSAKNRHYMLLCKEYNYYTIFENVISDNSSSNFSSTVAEIIFNVGDVYSIDKTKDNLAIEIWIKPINEESPLVFYLFPYDEGVVYYE